MTTMGQAISEAMGTAARCRYDYGAGRRCPKFAEPGRAKCKVHRHLKCAGGCKRLAIQSCFQELPDGFRCTQPTCGEAGCECPHDGVAEQAI